MKIKYVVALLSVLLLAIGCAPQEPEVTEPVSAPEPVVTEPVATEPEVVVDEKPTGLDITLTKKGFSPDTLTVQSGTMVTFIAKEGRHRLSVGGEGISNTFQEGETAEYMFDQVGEWRVFDVVNKKSAYITVE